MFYCQKGIVRVEVCKRSFQVVLRASAEAGAAVADEHFFALVRRAGKIVKRGGAIDTGVADEVFIGEFFYVFFRKYAFGFRQVTHFFEEVFSETFAPGQGSDIFRHND